MRKIALAAMLALAACQPNSGSEPAEETASTDAAADAAAEAEARGVPITNIGDLIGEYRVAGIDGEALDADFGIALSIDGPMMSFEPVCAGFVWDIAFEGDRLVTARHREAPPPAPGAPPPPACAIGVHPAQAQLGQALDAVDRAERTPDNGIVLSGNGRSVTLFTQ